jgi:DNA (cytosine-5)-methyltransferase 1
MSLTPRRKDAKTKRITAVDLFAGCGGASCGLIQAGIDVIAMVEYDTTAALTYAVNLCRYDEMQFHFITPHDRRRMECEARKAVEKDKGCRAGSGWIRTRRKISGCRHVIIGDIRLLSGERLLEWIGMKRGELDIMTMSPPCQGFSTANSNNKGRGKFTNHTDPRNDLCFEAARLIADCQPRTIALENVPGFGKSPQFEMFKKFISGGKEAAQVFEQLLPSHPHWRYLL